ncbi:hypothetical protein [Myxacorys almedinensis]|uniref:Uncharacterized protein n=1 Tax=Myxacorys almedinensis A TaxID=2690445 RepID=A0A8J7Z517_9CYAN|nr:hypothetical protein [Myxacorys almedinensis]NDJ18233.1 hypothetical protein [Myxacorys almedinensis A]
MGGCCGFRLLLLDAVGESGDGFIEEMISTILDGSWHWAERASTVGRRWGSSVSGVTVSVALSLVHRRKTFDLTPLATAHRLL